MVLSSKIRHLVYCTILALSALTASASSPEIHAADSYHSNSYVWGAEFGGGIDLTTNDLSTVNIGAFFGYRNSCVNALGIGAEINMMVNNNYTAFPIYVIFRTNFRDTPSIVFMDLRAGCAINNLVENTRQTTFYTSPGIGFNLATGKKFKSYLILSYTYNGIKPFDDGTRHIDVNGLQLATLRLGISF